MSFHPGQFVCLASVNPDIVRRSAEEFEYHTDCARWMGYGSSWHDQGFKINVHMSGRLGAEGFRNGLNLLSPEARNLITVENDEMEHGFKFNDAVLRHLVVRMKKAFTTPSPMMKEEKARNLTAGPAPAAPPAAAPVTPAPAAAAA